MPVHASGSEQTLETSAEQKLFGEACRQSYYQQIHNQRTDRGVSHKCAHGVKICILKISRHLAKTLERVGEFHVVVPIYDVFLYRDRYKKHCYDEQ